MQLISGAAQASAASNWCHWCAATKTDIRNGQNVPWPTDLDRFKSTPGKRLLSRLWATPTQIFLDELHWRLRVYGVILNEIEAKVFHATDRDNAQTQIKAEMVRCGITHFEWYARIAPGQPVPTYFFFRPLYICHVRSGNSNTRPYKAPNTGSFKTSFNQAACSRPTLPRAPTWTQFGPG